MIKIRSQNIKRKIKKKSIQRADQKLWLKFQINLKICENLLFKKFAFDITKFEKILFRKFYKIN